MAAAMAELEIEHGAGGSGSGAGGAGAGAKGKSKAKGKQKAPRSIARCATCKATDHKYCTAGRCPGHPEHAEHDEWLAAMGESVSKVELDSDDEAALTATWNTPTAQHKADRVRSMVSSAMDFYAQPNLKQIRAALPDIADKTMRMKIRRALQANATKVFHIAGLQKDIDMLFDDCELLAWFTRVASPAAIFKKLTSDEGIRSVLETLPVPGLGDADPLIKVQTQMKALANVVSSYIRLIRLQGKMMQLHLRAMDDLNKAVAMHHDTTLGELGRHRDSLLKFARNAGLDDEQLSRVMFGKRRRTLGDDDGAGAGADDSDSSDPSLHVGDSEEVINVDE